MKTLARRRRRIRDWGTIGFIPIGVTIVTLESNFARQMVVVVAVLYAAAMGIVLLRTSRCLRCGSLLSIRDIKLGQTTITVPWFFRPSCQRCGWVEGDNVEEES